MHPHICTSIRSSRLSQISRLIQLALEKGSDFVEIRLDYLSSFDFKGLREAVGNNSQRCIFTCRPVREGGHFQGGEDERFKLLSSLIPLKPAYFDIELDTLRSRRVWADQISSLTTKLIVSYHNLRETPPPELLKEVWDEASNLGDVVKIVTTAKGLKDNVKVLTLYKMVEPERLIAFCMGRQGVLSRVLCPLLGSPFTYASLEGRRTAPGQLPIEVLKELYEGVEKAF